jgi:hypothetical protein
MTHGGSVFLESVLNAIHALALADKSHWSKALIGLGHS